MKGTKIKLQKHTMINALNHQNTLKKTFAIYILI